MAKHGTNSPLFFKANTQRLLHFLRARLANDADAEELAQEAYLRLLRVSRHALIRNPQAYLYRIARNLVYELYAGTASIADVGDSNNLDELAAQDPSPEDARERADRLRLIEQALAEVSPKCRAVVLLYWHRGMTQQEIAKELGISRSMVQKYMAAGIAHCQTRLRLRRD